SLSPRAELLGHVREPAVAVQSRYAGGRVGLSQGHHPEEPGEADPHLDGGRRSRSLQPEHHARRHARLGRRQSEHGEGAGGQGLQVPVRVLAQFRSLRSRHEAADAAAGTGVAMEGLPGSVAPGGTVRPPDSLVTWTQVIYGLHAFSLLTGILGAATVVGAFLTGWPSIIAVILNYVKRSQARGTWLESHFRWQIRTFWFGLFWISLCVVFIIATLGIGILVAWLPMSLVGLWFVYRIARGWLALNSGRPMYV